MELEMASKPEPSRLKRQLTWTQVTAGFFTILIILASLVAVADAQTPESAIIILAVVLPIGWIVLRDDRYPNKLWGTVVVLPVSLWITFALLG